MKKYSHILIALMLSACSSSLPISNQVDNEDVTNISTCSEIRQELANSSKSLQALNEQRKLTTASNGLMIASSVLTSNPVLLLEVKKTKDINDAIKSYKQRTTLLDKKIVEICQQKQKQEPEQKPGQEQKQEPEQELGQEQKQEPEQELGQEQKQEPEQKLGQEQK